jgi:hypothetical protein
LGRRDLRSARRILGDDRVRFLVVAWLGGADDHADAALLSQLLRIRETPVDEVRHRHEDRRRSRRRPWPVAGQEQEQQRAADQQHQQPQQAGHPAPGATPFGLRFVSHDTLVPAAAVWPGGQDQRRWRRRHGLDGHRGRRRDDRARPFREGTRERRSIRIPQVPFQGSGKLAGGCEPFGGISRQRLGDDRVHRRRDLARRLPGFGHGRTDEGGGGSDESRATATAAAESPDQARRPVSISQSTRPSEYTSDRAVTTSPRACSGLK